GRRGPDVRRGGGRDGGEATGTGGAAGRAARTARSRRRPGRDPGDQGRRGRRGVRALRGGPAADVPAVRGAAWLGDRGARLAGVGPRRVQGRRRGGEDEGRT